MCNGKGLHLGQFSCRIGVKLLKIRLPPVSSQVSKYHVDIQMLTVKHFLQVQYPNSIKCVCVFVHVSAVMCVHVWMNAHD